MTVKNMKNILKLNLFKKMRLFKRVPTYYIVFILMISLLFSLTGCFKESPANGKEKFKEITAA